MSGSTGDGALSPATLTGLAELGLGPQPLPRLEALVAAQLRRPRVRVRTARMRAHDIVLMDFAFWGTAR